MPILHDSGTRLGGSSTEDAPVAIAASGDYVAVSVEREKQAAAEAAA
jgi:hypothetical protein